MLDSGKKSALNKKAYEIAYALFRVAAKMGERGIAEPLKVEAVHVLEMVVAHDRGEASKALEVLDYLVKLAMDLNAIGFANGEVLTKEIGNLKLMIAESVEGQGEAVDIPDLFPVPGAQFENRPETQPPQSIFEMDAEEISEMPQDVSSRSFFSDEGIAVSRAEEYQSKIPLKKEDFQGMDSRRNFASVARISSSENEQSGNSSSGGFLKSGMRQIAILDKIRQSDNCRLRDIQEILPDSSERTIRYDLESLIERRLIERVGNGGPSVSYRMRQS